MLNNILVYVTPSGDSTKIEIDNLITEISMQCGLDKPYVTLNFTIPYGIYSKSIPSYWLDTGTKVEMYDFISGNLKFVGIVDKAKISGKEEKLEVTCNDYVYNLTKSRVYYNFKNMSAYDCVKKIFDDLEIPYSTDNESGLDSIFGGRKSDDGNIAINHIVKNKSAYETIMCIATDCHMSLGYYYYVYMDAAGNVGVNTCDRYWAGQTIESGKDGNLLDCSYSKDSSDIVTKIICYTSEGDEEDLDEDSSSSAGSNGKVIGIDMGHNSHVSGASALLDEVTENRKVGNEVISLLKNAGYTAIDCTDNDGTTESQELSNRISKMNAQKLDLSISIHFDAGGGSGTSVYYNSKAGNTLAYGFLAKVSQSCGFNSRTVSLHDGSDGGESFAVLRRNNNPAILLEVCFVDSQKDKGLYDASKVANAIVEAVKAEVR